MIRSFFFLLFAVSASLVLLWVGVLLYTSTNPFGPNPWAGQPAAAGAQHAPGS